VRTHCRIASRVITRTPKKAARVTAVIVGKFVTTAG
jgi:hypothetical protein